MSDGFQRSAGAPIRAPKTDVQAHLAAIEERALACISYYNLRLKGWKFAWDNAVTRAGYCQYRTRTISLSRPLMSTWTMDAAVETILHEIAHALAGPGTAHNHKWRAICVKLGIKPQRCWHPSDDTPALPSKYVGTCPAGHEFQRERKATSARSCDVCSPRSFDRRYIITWRLR